MKKFVFAVMLVEIAYLVLPLSDHTVRTRLADAPLASIVYGPWGLKWMIVGKSEADGWRMLRGCGFTFGGQPDVTGTFSYFVRDVVRDDEPGYNLASKSCPSWYD